MIDQWDRRSIETLQPAAKQLSGSSSSPASSSASSSSPEPLQLGAESSALWLRASPPTVGSPTSSHKIHLIATDMTNVGSYIDNRNFGLMNQNFGEEEPEQLHEKLEPSGGRQRFAKVAVERGAGEAEGRGDVEPVSGAKAVPSPAETIKSTTDVDADGPLKAACQHDAAPIRAADALTSLFSHVDKGKSRRRRRQQSRPTRL